jgi:hypothetical protein
MARIPALDHPDRWLYDEIQTMQLLLASLAYRHLGNEASAERLLAAAAKRIDFDLE